MHFIKISNPSESLRFYQAGSFHLFGLNGSSAFSRRVSDDASGFSFYTHKTYPNFCHHTHLGQRKTHPTQSTTTENASDSAAILATLIKCALLRSQLNMMQEEVLNHKSTNTRCNTNFDNTRSWERLFDTFPTFSRANFHQRSERPRYKPSEQTSAPPKAKPNHEATNLRDEFRHKFNACTTEGDVKKCFRQLARKYHPDKNPDNVAVSTEQFRILDEIYHQRLKQL